MEVLSKNPEETRKLAAKLAAQIMEESNRTKAVVIGLEGELGAGKTTFIQAFVRAMGINDKVKSPTFLLMKYYPFANGFIYHIDCYRINDPKELIALEIESIFNNPKNIVLIEWPERVNDILPASMTRIHIDHISEQERKITIS